MSKKELEKNDLERIKFLIYKNLPCYKKNFLIKNNVLEEFIYNFTFYASYYSTEKDRLVAIKEDDDFINTSFVWDATPQNHQFWSDLNYECKEWIDSLRNKYKKHGKKRQKI